MADIKTETVQRLSLREQVEALLPSWSTWYPSLFDAAQDLGLIRARVCAPSSLVLSNRHAGIYSEALQAFREKWSVEEPESVADASERHRKHGRQQKTRMHKNQRIHHR